MDARGTEQKGAHGLCTAVLSACCGVPDLFVGSARQCQDQTTRKTLLNNLIDEEAGSPNHPDLWLNFAKSLGVSAFEARKSEKWPETKNLIDTFRSVCRDGSTVEGLAALYAYESQIPSICESKIDGLKKTLRLR